jgi:phosphoesterase RecJ-like protein
MSSVDWSILSDFLKRNDRIVLTTHIRPDGDALGSEVALAHALLRMGKDIRCVNTSPLPPRYDFLDPDRRLLHHYQEGGQSNFLLKDAQALIILDLSSWSQLGRFGEWVRQFKGPKLVIDHHVSRDPDLAQNFLVDTSIEATGRLVFEAINHLKGKINSDIATGILTAIAMDTGWFRHPNTSAGTLRIIADLIEAGAPISDIFKKLFERNTLGRLRLVGETLASLKTDFNGRVAWATVTRDALEKVGALPSDTEDLVDHTVSILGVELGFLLMELPAGGIKLSLRSRGEIDCCELAGKFGGGGHRAASGATLPEPVEKALESVKQQIALMLKSS